MPLGVSYMGTKRNLANDVACVISRSRSGPLLDLFSGMCSVGEAVAPSRQVWNNDLQVFAYEVARSFFTSDGLPPNHLDMMTTCLPRITQKVQFLKDLFRFHYEKEVNSLSSGDLGALQEIENAFPSEYTGEKYSLFAAKYSGSYIGCIQAVEVDAIRAVIDELLHEDRISDQSHRWMLLALCRSVSRCSTSTGHFAQPLKVKPSNLRKYISQRRRSILKEWSSALQELLPVGSQHWRRRNYAFRGEAIGTLQSFSGRRKPAVIYADPPYTSDQYSRYYHIYETLILYDHPDVDGEGRYRAGRAVSGFSLKSSVLRSLLSLIENASNLGADLVLSYPTNGLLPNSREALPELLKRYYPYCEPPMEMQHSHSTMGGSKGAVRQTVTEVLYRAYFK
ncbi:DNA adenine methylase [Rhizobium leguminosarum]|uniref:DNA adenine methylase n=1 Tax=Rhizobium leguminosarum TaxID=384 RepID=A0ACD5EZP8_RHILE|nr:DNA adenine methylase [Rhizobium leguminosarum]